MATLSPVAPGTRTRPDLDVQDEIWDALWSDGQIRALERGNFDVEVTAGAVRLTGHVASVLMAEAIEDQAWGVPGVVAVANQLVADAELEFAISEALAVNPQTRPCGLRVNAFHGWINITGEVPSPAEQDAARASAVTVPGVRGILGLPHIAGEQRVELRRALQPRIGASVYSDDGLVGRVRSVVINPKNRLVEAVATRGRFEADSQTINHEFLVRVDAIEAVSGAGVFVPNSSREVAEWAAAEQPALSAPPAGWQPPFPYLPSQAQWFAGAQP